MKFACVFENFLTRMTGWSSRCEHFDSVCSAVFYYYPPSGVFRLVRLDLLVMVVLLFWMLCLSAEFSERLSVCVWVNIVFLQELWLLFYLCRNC